MWGHRIGAPTAVPTGYPSPLPSFGRRPEEQEAVAIVRPGWARSSGALAPLLSSDSGRYGEAHRSAAVTAGGVRRLLCRGKFRARESRASGRHHRSLGALPAVVYRDCRCSHPWRVRPSPADRLGELGQAKSVSTHRPRAAIARLPWAGVNERRRAGGRSVPRQSRGRRPDSHSRRIPQSTSRDAAVLGWGWRQTWRGEQGSDPMIWVVSADVAAVLGKHVPTIDRLATV